MVMAKLREEYDKLTQNSSVNGTIALLGKAISEIELINKRLECLDVKSAKKNQK